MKRSRRILAILALLILWPISLGPVAWAEWNGYAPGWVLDAMQPIHRPFHSEVFDGIREWYVGTPVPSSGQCFCDPVPPGRAYSRPSVWRNSTPNSARAAFVLQRGEIIAGARAFDDRYYGRGPWNAMMNPANTSYIGVIENGIECQPLPETGRVERVAFRLARSLNVRGVTNGERRTAHQAGGRFACSEPFSPESAGSGTPNSVRIAAIQFAVATCCDNRVVAPHFFQRHLSHLHRAACGPKAGDARLHWEKH